MSSAVHPEIGSLIREKDLMHAYIEKRDYFNALLKMERLLSDIRKKDADAALVDTVDREIKKVERLGPVSRQRRFKTMKSLYTDWKKQIIQILWDKGYLDEANYSGGFFDPSSGKKSGTGFKR